MTLRCDSCRRHRPRRPRTGRCAALFNLLQNAVQWSPDGATVEVRVIRAAGGRWRVEVADRGPGKSLTEATGAVHPVPHHPCRRHRAGAGDRRTHGGAHGWTAGYTPRPGGGGSVLAGRAA
ncbi:MAG: hypothetical protein U0736_25300 [Gemmataceae bacterium]